MAKPESYFHSRQIIVPSGDFPYLIADLREATMPKNEAEANAVLIVAAVNACFQINPENPMAVAEALPGLVEAAKEALRQLEAFFDKAYCGDPYDGRPRNKLEIQLRAAFAKLEAKA